MKPIKIANRQYERICGYHEYAECVYDISDYAGKEIDPCQPNDSGVLPPLLWFAFKNTKTALYLINVSRKPDGNYVFGYEIKHGAYGGGSSCFPSMRWKHNNPRSDTLKDCLKKALRYIKTTYEHYQGEDNREVAKAASEALKAVSRMQVRQMSIFDII